MTGADLRCARRCRAGNHFDWLRQRLAGGIDDKVTTLLQ